MNDIESIIPAWAIVVIGFLSAVAMLLIVRHLLMRRLRQMVERSRFRLGFTLLDSLRLPMTLLGFAVLIWVAEHLSLYAGLLSDPESFYTDGAVKILIIVSAIIFTDRFAHRFVDQHAERNNAFKNSRPIVVGTARGLIFVLGALVLLSTLGISITPIIASLGITSLAVALALQPTLENFFSGVQLVMDKPIRVGDFIELASGEQGFVDKIGWRSTWIRMLPNNTVIMPNSELSKSKIINYFYPEKELSVPVEVSVHYHSDLEHVERVTLEVARQILISHEWGVDDYKTFVLFHTFDSSSINLTVMLRAKEYFNRFWVKSAFIKALHKRYAEEGIVIPYPIRAINTSQETGRPLSSVLNGETQPSSLRRS